MFKNEILKFTVTLKNSNQNNFQPMKLNLKKQYDSPRIKVLEIKFEGFVCESPTGGTQDYNSGILDEND